MLSQRHLPKVRIIAERPGLFATTGRKVRAIADDDRIVHFVLITDADEAGPSTRTPQ